MIWRSTAFPHSNPPSVYNLNDAMLSLPSGKALRQRQPQRSYYLLSQFLNKGSSSPPPIPGMRKKMEQTVLGWAMFGTR
ncbi:hypothetical protein FUA25_04335 [Chryseobacterium sp.]|nr:hypothetical protein FUA25_04335 [Chryseobacterium sp.]